MLKEAAIDWTLCIERAAGDEAMARDMLVAIVEELPTFQQDMVQAFAQADYQLVASIAHKVNGLCCYSGLPRLKTSAHQLEEHILKKNEAMYGQCYQSLIENIDQVLQQFSEEYA